MVRLLAQTKTHFFLHEHPHRLPIQHSRLKGLPCRSGFQSGVGCLAQATARFTDYGDVLNHARLGYFVLQLYAAFNAVVARFCGVHQQFCHRIFQPLSPTCFEGRRLIDVQVLKLAVDVHPVTEEVVFVLAAVCEKQQNSRCK